MIIEWISPYVMMVIANMVIDGYDQHGYDETYVEQMNEWNMME